MAEATSGDGLGDGRRERGELEILRKRSVETEREGGYRLCVRTVASYGVEQLRE